MTYWPLVQWPGEAWAASAVYSTATSGDAALTSRGHVYRRIAEQGVVHWANRAETIGMQRNSFKRTVRGRRRRPWVLRRSRSHRACARARSALRVDAGGLRAKYPCDSDHDEKRENPENLTNVEVEGTPDDV